MSLYVLCCSVNVSVFCMPDSVCDLFGETIRNVFMHVVPVIPMCI